jgi:hypothetical protein
MKTAFQPGKTNREYFDDWHVILQPWLGEVSPFNLPSNPDDIIIGVNGINGHGFSRLTFWTLNPNPDWILPRWRTTEIEALLKSHRTGPNAITGAPFIFCNCIRLEPSRLPSLSFFMKQQERRANAIAWLFDRILY